MQPRGTRGESGGQTGEWQILLHPNHKTKIFSPRPHLRHLQQAPPGLLRGAAGPGHDRRREHAVEGGCGAPEEAQHHSLNGPRRYEYLYICLVDCCKQTVMLIISSVLKSSLLTPNMSVTFIEMLILLNYN